MSKIALSTSHLTGHELTYIQDAFQRNEVSVYGANLAHFENDLEVYLGESTKVACTISGTAAIHLALILAGVTKDDEVLCQSMTYVASANPILYQGAIPVFVGSETETWNMCPDALEIAIKDRISKGKIPKAIIVVHSYGMPAQIDKIAKLAKQYNITLVEDAAEALGSKFKEKKCGTFGDFSVISFNSNKIITTAGGGAIVCKNEEMKQKAIFLATQAREKVPYYLHSEIGYNYRMSNIAAGIGRAQMKVLQNYINKRRENHDFYNQLFKNIAGTKVLKETSTDYFSNHWLTCVLINKEKAAHSSEELRIALQNENIESRPLWKPLHLHPMYAKFDFYGEKVGENLFNTGLCLPSGSNLTTQEKQRITQVIAAFLA